MFDGNPGNSRSTSNRHGHSSKAFNKNKYKIRQSHVFFFKNTYWSRRSSMMAFCGVFWTTQDASRPVQQSPASLQLPNPSILAIKQHTNNTVNQDMSTDDPGITNRERESAPRLLRDISSLLHGCGPTEGYGISRPARYIPFPLRGFYTEEGCWKEISPSSSH